MSKVLGICCARLKYNEKEKYESAHYEIIKLYEEGKKYYDDVLVFHPSEVNYKLIRSQKEPIVSLKGKDITNLSTLIIRRVKLYEKATSILARILDSCGCDLFDPIDRFQGNSPSKLLTTVNRYEKGVGVSSYIAASFEGATQLISEFDNQQFPVIVKPIDGRGGEGVELLNNLNEAIEYAKKFFEENQERNQPILFQEFVRIKSEYRVIIVDGQSLGVVEKIAQLGTIAANAAQGGNFIATDADDVINLAVNNVSKRGILGVDVVRDFEEKLYILEANRSPQWKAFEEATGINVAQEIIVRASNRLNRVKDSES